MRKTAFTACLLLLAACATHQLDEGLKGLMGRNISEAVNRMGYPDGKREMMGDTIYVWSTNHTGVMPLNMPSTTTGNVGGTPYYSTTNTMHMIPIAYACTVQIATTADGTIKSYQWEGNEGGCRRYSRGFH
jgi:hypothetical protein